MPQPISDARHDQQCHHYQAPTGQRCGSPAIKGEYYCYFHNIKRRKTRILIDPEITRMELPVIEDRASIFVSLAAVIHRLAENTVDTKRAGQMIYALQTALQALPPEPAVAPVPPQSQPEPTPPDHHLEQPPAHCHSEQSPTACHPERSEESPHSSAHSAILAPAAATPPAPQETTDNAEPTTPKTIAITKDNLLYFLRARHCYNCNAELFPADDLTERPNPGAPAEVIEENQHIKRLSDRYPANCSPALLLNLHAAGEAPNTHPMRARMAHPSCRL